MIKNFTSRPGKKKRPPPAVKLKEGYWSRNPAGEASGQGPA